MSTKKIIIFLTMLTILMFGFSFALAPLYKVLCNRIGLNNSVRIKLPEHSNRTNAITSRSLVIQFITINNKNLDWDFYPYATTLQVHPGEVVKVLFFAKNKTRKTMTVQAIPSFMPAEAGNYFKKIECFCFSQQTLHSGESVEMPVLFQIDDNMPAYIHTISLSYTLFDVTS